MLGTFVNGHCQTLMFIFRRGTHVDPSTLFVTHQKAIAQAAHIHVSLVDGRHSHGDTEYTFNGIWRVSLSKAIHKIRQLS